MNVDKLDIPFIDIFDRAPDIAARLDAVVASLDANEEGLLFDYMPIADAKQQQFMHLKAPTIRLLAPAGSGKTQSVVNRIIYSIGGGQKPDSFLVLTFDNSACLSLTEKFQAGLNAQQITLNTKPSFQTLNKFGYGLLHDSLASHFESKLTLGADPVWDQRETVKRAKTMLREQNREAWNLLPRELGYSVYLGVISALKNEIIDPNALMQGDRQHLERLISLFESSRLLEPWLTPWRNTMKWTVAARQIPNALIFIYMAYCTLMRNHGRIDFDDQKLLAYTALAKDANMTAQILASIKTVIVDEFQDINRLDFELVRLLAKDRELVIVGDDDQAIYAFRGCTPRYIIDFEKESGRPTTSIILSANYRCPKNIVAMANKLIANNTNRVEKYQIAHRTDNADVQLWHAINAGGEAQVIARTIRKLHEERQEKGLRYSDMAVLFRMNSQSLPLQIALILEEIPYYCRKEDNVIVSSAMSELIDLLGLHLQLVRDHSYFDASAARLVCRTYFRYIQDDSVKKFVDTAQREGLLRAAEILSSQPNAPQEFKDPALHKGLSALAQPGTPSRVVGVVSEHFKHVSGMVGTLEDAINNQAPLGEFAEIAARFRGSIADFHTLLSSLQERVRNGLHHAELGGDAVNLLTYFRAKGLQWNTVFIPGVNQKVIPHAKANVEDERRLFYVAVTRASSNLIFSYVRTVVGQTVEPSQFLAEMDLVGATERRATFIK